ncbi:diaminobutyrate acetyltransferase [Endozoicomonas elysicola]|uniref:diaminobutyrate acetyltransferase n=1 Tax=Endozoicomonas elysicola TaxID=305900 RepID=UPI0022A9989D|nr:diaminobutyrate acetyltransferase [Endozoicomonas elysicola]
MHISYREPNKMDGNVVHQLINRCPPLDKNSLYCNLLQCTDFASTSIVAESADGDIVGFISGYIPPDSSDTLFIWQVALDQQCRGRGIASQMLNRLFARHKQLQRLKTTISPDNIPSQKLFQAFFENQGMTVETFDHFKSGIHLDKDHEDEILYLGTKTRTSEAVTPRSSSEQFCHLTEAIG